jgi:hypothetical protein
VWSELKRRLYRGGRPGALVRWINRGFAALHASRFAPAHWVTLDVVGRRSGRVISFPVAVLVRGGDRFLVSMLGRDAAWVRNVRAAGGRATLRHGRVEPVRLEEVAVESRAPLLKAYLQVAPGARPHLPVDKDAPVAAFEKIAAEFPVFRVRAVV